MRWFIWMTGGVALSFIGFIAVWHHNSGVEQASIKWISNYYQAKDKLMSETSSKGRIVIVAGSNGLFAFDNVRLSRELKREVVNYSSAAGLGLRFILEQAKRNLRSGDIVLLPLEYIFYNDKMVSDVTLPLYAISHPQTLEYYAHHEQLSIILHTPFTNTVAPVVSKVQSMRDELFDVSNLNKHGDIKTEVIKRMYVEHDLQSHKYALATAEPVSDRSRQLLSEFVQWADSKNVTLMALPPATQSHAGLDSQYAREKKQAIQSLWLELGIRFLLEFELLEFEKEYMFDTAYHLNHEGRARFTDNIIEQLAFAL